MRQCNSWMWMVIVATLCLRGSATLQLIDEPSRLKGKKLAVVPGLTNPSSLQAAPAFSDEVGRASRYQVLPQKQVAQAIPNYPQLMKGAYTSAYREIDEDYGKTDVGRVREIQKHLGVDYRYILWAPTSIQSGGKGLFFKNSPVVHVVAQVFEFPGGKEIGRGKYMVRFDDDRSRFCATISRLSPRSLLQRPACRSSAPSSFDRHFHNPQSYRPLIIS